MGKIKAVIFDFGYTIYDPDEKRLLDHAQDTFMSLQGMGLKLALVSRTQFPKKRIQQIKDLGLNKYFDYIDAIEKGGTKEFMPIINKFGFNPDEFLVIGDRPSSEIKEGNILGMATCRINYGPNSFEKPQSKEEMPKTTIKFLKEVLELV
jgi:FMN phosphatase YigB (HAD superfamily)